MKKNDGQSFIITRMKIGKRRDLVERLLSLDMTGIIQTAIIERFNLTLRHGVAPLKAFVRMQRTLVKGAFE